MLSFFLKAISADFLLVTCMTGGFLTLLYRAHKSRKHQQTQTEDCLEGNLEFNGGDRLSQDVLFMQKRFREIEENLEQSKGAMLENFSSMQEALRHTKRKTQTFLLAVENLYDMSELPTPENPRNTEGFECIADYSPRNER